MAPPFLAVRVTLGPSDEETTLVRMLLLLAGLKVCRSLNRLHGSLLGRHRLRGHLLRRGM